MHALYPENPEAHIPLQQEILRYSLTERGISLMEVLDQLCTWGEENRRPIPETR
ncbi:MAG: winged helix-turn-helix transcriptional regulator [Roseburia sp.]|nr:winged helix-turn-helix transcriptional regulator [Roseburia sp.]